MKLLGIISVNFEVIDHCWSDILHSPGTEENMRSQLESILAIYRLQGSLNTIHFRRKYYTIFSLNLVSLLTKMCVNKTYNKFRIGKYLPVVFPIRNGLKLGHDLSPVFSTWLRIRHQEVPNKQISTDWMRHVCFWSMPMMLISWFKTYTENV
jgi:hypothetical protein